MLSMIRRLTLQDWALLRDARLAALADAPRAFGSSLAQEQEYTEARWREWAGGDERRAWFADIRDGTPHGLVLGLLPEAGPARLHAMWVRPESRGQGVGAALLEHVAAWARERGARRLELSVAETNCAALELYERLGFVPIGNRRPLRSHPDLAVIDLALDL
jgi:GNAT superfamily N-acetyltransferase